MTYIKLFILSSLLLLNLSSIASSRETNAFQVEVIGFMPKKLVLKNNQIYPKHPELNKTRTLLATNEPITPYMQLPKERFILQKQAGKLALQYQLLFHLAWIQKDNQRQAIAIKRDNVSGQDLIGSIKISQGHYYYFTSDLLLGEHTAINAQRRLKKDELHYIDSPYVSLLVTIHPVTFKKANDAL